MAKTPDELKKLENNIIELRTELENTKELVKKHNEIRKDMMELFERLKAIEIREEEKEKQISSSRAETSIKQEWFAVIISSVAVLITLVNVIWG
ncbi:hypothetical protein [Natranaerofaba carboxydovora]|uniref:hypothetical protein n=1 Tax=Natranaerofaba carboxydovora TaxID=2742683 RepID=UPI001F137999|nr:hypothetical protein [Natranaerofaba carboxydovora]UMZ72511.1 hypothetical protein ACONDI_00030 [Natranaerofaba carboxydovora]